MTGWTGVDLGAIWESSRGILLGQVEVIARTVVAGIEGRLDLDGQREAGREAHKLAGSLGTFGLHDGSRLARALELALAPVAVLSPTDALELSQLVVDLQAAMARPLPAPALGADLAGDPDEPGLLVVEADEDHRRRVVEAAAGHGLRATAAATLDAARALLATSPPAIVVVDAAVAEGVDGVASFLAEAASHPRFVASVVLVAHAGMAERVRAARIGARSVLEKPVAPDAVVEAVTRLLARDRATATVLMVDDDPTFLVLVGELLGAQGLAVEAIGDPGQLWSALEAIEPDLLLLDNDMPGVDGISLCQAIRGDERWARLPVVFLSGSESSERVRAMFDAGADDFVPKPVSGDDLVTRVTNRLRRSRAHSDRGRVDLATGLPGPAAFVEDATRLLGLARRDGRPAVLAVAELDPPDPPALAAFGRLLRQAAEDEDAVGAWPGGRLAAVLYGMAGAEAESHLARVLHLARTARSARSADAGRRALVGVATFPEDGTDVRSLGAAAEAALGRAREAAGDAIARHQSGSRPVVEIVDVLLVDDDEALGTLVVHSLAGRGWDVRWLRDGAEAVTLLDDPAFRARCVLLDVGLPGLDGLSVLRHLAQAGQLTGTRVVMLTVRANEGEVLEALDLGAFDHVAKPFSLSVLAHRVRRAIEAAGIEATR